MPKVPAIVFTDLDGTLLDHGTYSYAAAASTLNALKKNGIPVILASSKTAAELSALRSELGLSRYPAIVENGAGLLPAMEQPSDSQPDRYHALRATLSRISPDLRLCFKGFGDMTDAEVASDTGLSLTQAARARQRRFSEPGLWSGTPDQRDSFLAALSHHGVTGRKGGRYLTLSHGQTKADQMERICADYGHPLIVALGDAPNDLEMLLAADLPILIKNPHAAPLPRLTPVQHHRIKRSTRPGPEGWSEMLHPLIPALASHKTGA